MDAEKSKEEIIEDFEDENTMIDKYLTFTVADEDFGIEIRYIRDIIKKQKITSVPDTDDYLKGIINLRGKVIPVIDVRVRFKLPEIEYDDRTCIIVVNMNDVITGLIVDRVSEVIDIPESNVDAPPSAGRKKGSHYISGMGKIDDSVKMILDINKLLGEDSMKQLRETSREN